MTSSIKLELSLNDEWDNQLTKKRYVHATITITTATALTPSKTTSITTATTTAIFQCDYYQD